MTGGMTVDALLALVGSLGAASAPVFALMWHLERKRADRLQKLLFRYLPAFEQAAGTLRDLGKGIGAIEDDE